MAPKLSKDSEAVKTLISWFQSGKLTKKDKPGDVQISHSLFKPFKANTFRTRFNELKRDHCLETDILDQEPEEELDRRCSIRESSSGKKRKLLEEAVGSEGEEDLVNADTGGEELVLGDLAFKPLYLISTWQEPHTMTKRVSVAIVLPSGIGVGEFSLRVVGSGDILELTVVWPPPLIQMSILHKKWLNDTNEGFEIYHPKVVGFEKALRELRSRTSEKVESTARISLPIAVQTNIEDKFNLAWIDNSRRMLYVELKAIVENYALMNDTQEFEVL